MKWSEMTSRQPALGAIAQEKLIRPGVLLVGTVRRDGSARISGVEPLIMDGQLWLSMMSGSTKARDLRRDQRIVLHSIVTGPEAAPELKIRGTVREETDPRRLEAYASAVATQIGWQPVVGQFSLFSIDIDEITFIDYSPETGDQHVAQWPSNVEYLRPALTPTSLGPARPVRRILNTAE